MKEDKKEKIERALLQLILNFILLIIIAVMLESEAGSIWLLVIITLCFISVYFVTKYFGREILEYVHHNKTKLLLVLIILIISGFVYIPRLDFFNDEEQKMANTISDRD